MVKEEEGRKKRSDGYVSIELRISSNSEVDGSHTKTAVFIGNTFEREKEQQNFFK
ncbi:conserved hypothetical protein [Ricinus communis]|uniref:Uncharacterized protein n=1 Tax=Ricinus communis TaxID=3988 RepID=B9SBF7_RICCO|nr:conserved hypothetical protein [Ricinus communis]